MAYLNLFTNTKKTSPPELGAMDDWGRLERFLILGSEDGYYCVQDRPATERNLGSVKECLRSDGLRVVRTVLDIATSGRAPKNIPALEVLALASSPSFAGALTNATALAALPEVARTPADLRAFVTLVDEVRGWGRGLRSAIANWYLSKPAGELAYQIMKDAASDAGDEAWKHADLIRLSHPKAESPALNAVFQWAVEGVLGHLATADIRHGELRHVYAYEQVKKAASESEVVRWIEDVHLTHELIPRGWKQSARVWEALLENMPYPVMVSQLGKMTEVGLLLPHSAAAALVVARLMDRRRVANAKVHPIELLSVWLAYRKSNGLSNVLDALEDAFYLAFDNIEAPSGNIYLAIDSGSPVELAAAMAMVCVRGEGEATIGVFHDRLRPVNISRKDRFARVCLAMASDTSRARATGPIGSIPIDDARRRGMPVDTFIVLTGNPAGTWECNPAGALEEYRRATGIPAKLVVVGMTAEECPIGELYDAGQLYIAGFDASVLAVIAEFLRM